MLPICPKCRRGVVKWTTPYQDNGAVKFKTVYVCPKCHVQYYPAEVENGADRAAAERLDAEKAAKKEAREAKKVTVDSALAAILNAKVPSVESTLAAILA